MERREFMEIAESVAAEYLPAIKEADRSEFLRELLLELVDNGLDVNLDDQEEDEF